MITWISHDPDTVCVLGCVKAKRSGQLGKQFVLVARRNLNIEATLSQIIRRENHSALAGVANNAKEVTKVVIGAIENEPGVIKGNV
ncbi:hypothetical protein [Crateriforma conspicua]|uniref:hypothetical protein n=1 Tax=Crateriforma conspicua TaxID=2527996 RepID=UPI0011A75C10|nr:hypothetical protein [Crateriforma conspicua]